MAKSRKAAAPQEAPPETQDRRYDLSVRSDLIDLFQEPDQNKINATVRAHISSLLTTYGLDEYLVLFLYDEHDPITSYHANRLYQAASKGDKARDILLVVHSSGGSIEPAYLISKTCKRLSKDRFLVAVPRKAKSAATLIALGADEIHMGLMSELGPIDPQIGGYPSLSLSNALNVLADLSCKFPGSGEMFAQFLTKNLNLKDLGYFQRIGESAAQYAERLLTGKALPPDKSAGALADHFVNHYKDHGFVIDVDESLGILGPSIVKQGTGEYKAANAIYEFLDFASFLYGVLQKSRFDLVGGPDTPLMVRKTKADA